MNIFFCLVLISLMLNVESVELMIMVDLKLNYIMKLNNMLVLKLLLVVMFNLNISKARAYMMCGR